MPRAAATQPRKTPQTPVKQGKADLGNDKSGAESQGKRSWTFLTNHGHVLVCISQNPDIRIAEIADQVGIGERAAHRIVQDLVADGYVVRTHVGRRNTYSVDFSRSLRHPLESDHAIGDVFRVLAKPR